MILKGFNDDQPVAGCHLYVILTPGSLVPGRLDKRPKWPSLALHNYDGPTLHQIS